MMDQRDAGALLKAAGVTKEGVLVLARIYTTNKITMNDVAAFAADGVNISGLFEFSVHHGGSDQMIEIDNDLGGMEV